MHSGLYEDTLRYPTNRYGTLLSGKSHQCTKVGVDQRYHRERANVTKWEEQVTVAQPQDGQLHRTSAFHIMYISNAMREKFLRVSTLQLPSIPPSHRQVGSGFHAEAPDRTLIMVARRNSMHTLTEGTQQPRIARSHLPRLCPHPLQAVW